MHDVELCLIDPTRNRFRVYGLTETRTIFGELCLVIAWGRMGTKLKTRTEVFADARELDRRRRALLARRRRNGYGPREAGSIEMPQAPSPSRSASRTPPDKQTRLPFR